MKFQFTPLREGRPFFPRPRKVRTDFNSRPSARGDPYYNAQQTAMPISIHAPPRGATTITASSKSRRQISIHAPPRGATNHGKNAIFMRKFQFTPLREGRRLHPGKSRKTSLFQFTPLREGRPCRADTPQVDRLYFNSRPSARGDAFPSPAGSPSLPISIHAPPRGATLRFSFPHATRVFQFTPLREGRRQKICNFCKSFVQPLQISMA